MLFVIVPFVGAVITGAAGATVSIVRFTVFDTALTFPAASCCFAVIGCVPSDSAVVNVRLQVPSDCTSAVPIDVPLSYTVTVAPASPVPFIVGLLLFVIVPSAGAVITGADGTIVKFTVFDAPLTFPPESV